MSLGSLFVRFLRWEQFSNVWFCILTSSFVSSVSYSFSSSEASTISSTSWLFFYFFLNLFFFLKPLITTRFTYTWDIFLHYKLSWYRRCSLHRRSTGPWALPQWSWLLIIINNLFNFMVIISNIFNFSLIHAIISSHKTLYLQIPYAKCRNIH